MAASSFLAALAIAQPPRYAASIGADGKPLIYQWSIPQGSPSASILQGNAATPIIQFGQSRAAYTFLLTVTDSTGKSTTDLATVSFQGN